MKEHQRKGMAYVKSINIGWDSKAYEENYTGIFRKPDKEKLIDNKKVVDKYRKL